MKLRILLILGLLALTQAIDPLHHHHDDDDDEDDDEDDEIYDRDDRLCPDGYRYIGDDTPKKWDKGYIFFEEIGRSELYSCYRFMSQPMNFIEASIECSRDSSESKLVSFDDGEFEIRRFARAFFGNEDEEEEITQVLTSAVKFPDSEAYIWTVTNKVFNESKVIIRNPDEQCLILERLEKTPKYQIFSYPCMNQTTFACEMRVQTVTYRGWFMANWVNILLIFMVVLFCGALCLSACMYKSESRRRQRIVQHRPGPPPPPPQPQVYPDNPPSYETYVEAQRAHDGLPPKNETSDEGRFSQIKNRGREILATITLFNKK